MLGLGPKSSPARLEQCESFLVADKKVRARGVTVKMHRSYRPDHAKTDEEFRAWWLSRREGTDMLLAASHKGGDDHATRNLSAEEMQAHLALRFGPSLEARRSLATAYFAQSVTLKVAVAQKAAEKTAGVPLTLLNCSKCGRGSIGKATWTHQCPDVQDALKSRPESVDRASFTFAFEALAELDLDLAEVVEWGLEVVMTGDVWARLRAGGDLHHHGFAAVIGDTNLDVPVIVAPGSTGRWVMINCLARLFQATAGRLPHLDSIELDKKGITALVKAMKQGKPLESFGCADEACVWARLSPGGENHYCVDSGGLSRSVAGVRRLFARRRASRPAKWSPPSASFLSSGSGAS
jgi:hypothetical protein